MKNYSFRIWLKYTLSISVSCILLYLLLSALGFNFTEYSSVIPVFIILVFTWPLMMTFKEKNTKNLNKDNDNNNDS